MNEIAEWVAQRGKLHFSLIDPDKQSPTEAGNKASICASYDTDAIMVGGTTVNSREKVYNTVDAIKQTTDLPVILFPNSRKLLVENADYIFFMSLLNSTGYSHRFGEQLEGANVVNKLGLAPLPMGYMIVSTSQQPTTVERKTELDKVSIDDIDKAIKYALYTEYTGMRSLYIDAGSNPERPISNKMISAVREVINIPLIIGGGIRDAETAAQKALVGADVIVTGTAVEQHPAVIKEIVSAIKA